MKIQVPKTYIHTLKSLKKTMQNARLKAVLTANVQILATYWEIGNAISQQEQDQGWGSKVVEQLTRDLSIAFPDFKGLALQEPSLYEKFCDHLARAIDVERLRPGQGHEFNFAVGCCKIVMVSY